MSIAVPATATFAKRRLLALDMSRGVAALIVAAGHAELLYGNDYALCVVFFFILSGYVLSYAYGTALASGAMTTYEFVVVRIARLYPLHILTAAIVASMWAFAVLFRGHHPPDLTFVEVIETLTLTQSIFSGAWSLNLPSWSIGAEFWCGLLMIPLLRPNRSGRFIAICAGVCLFILTGLSGGFVASSTLRYGTAAGCFVIGWGLFSTIPPLKLEWLGWSILACAFVALSFPVVTAEGRPLVEVIYVAAFAAGIVLLSDARIPNLLKPAAEFAGNVSYGIYLWHWPLLRVMGPLTTPLRVILFFVSLFVLSWVGYRYFELPMRKTIRGVILRPLIAAA